ncbi:thiol:disulfide interchange protein DsbD [gamma proteobacterium HTCC5015]|nr:thiol:disulfide interchange protein DsbD [gamma proteobacterium HTCC5015]
MLRLVLIVLMLAFNHQATASEEFLPPDQAFALEQTSQGDQTQLHWDIAEGYYLYRDRIHIWADGQELTVDVWPESVRKDDPNFGVVDVYKHALSVTVRHSLGSQIKVQYQGCAEAGLCYPPQTRHLQIKGGAVNSEPEEVPVSSAQSIVDALASRSPIYTLLLFLGMGVVTAFSGCSYPMFPILSRVIIGNGNVKDIGRMRGFTLSLAYVIPIATVYAAIGVVAGLLGKNLSSWFQTPWALAAIATILVLMGLSMIGLYEIGLPSQLQSRLDQISRKQKGGSYTGAAIMGFISAFIVSACVVPPMVAATTFITQSGNWLLGASAMFFFGFGLGVPLLMLGASASWLLPKAGNWMLTLQRVMGFLLFTAAIWIADRFLPGWFTQILWAGLAAGAGVFVLKNSARSLHKWLALALFLLSGMLMVWPAIQNGGGHSGLPFETYDSMERFDQVLAAGKKPVIVDIYADWCTACQTLEHKVLPAPGIQQKLEQFTRIKLDLSSASGEEQAFLKRYRILGPPTFLFLAPSGDELEHLRITGEVDAPQLSKTLTRAIGPIKKEP